MSTESGVKLKSKALPKLTVTSANTATLENEDASRRFTVKVVGHSKDLLRVKIRGVDDRNTAETLIGTGLYISRTLLPELAEEEYYHADLIGLEARSTAGDKLGEVNAVYNFGAGDLIEIKMTDGNLEMVAFHQTICSDGKY